jgi:hypothetical protein
MTPFKKYLSEGKKQYDFRVKIAGEVSKDSEVKLEALLSKFKVASFKKLASTPVQQFPLDFPKLKNSEVNIYEVTLDYPTTQFELTEYIASNLSIAKENLAVRRPGEPSEQYQEVVEKREGALLDDPTYKEAPNAKFEDFYGDKYNSGFVKELNDILKLQRKERGEVIPSETDAKYNTDSAQNNASPIKQSDYNPIRN